MSADLAVTWYQLAQAEAEVAILEQQLATSALAGGFAMAAPPQRA